ncbi:MAG: hypothetical protein KKG70_02265, partial [Proteobacteria bacterium]|nr:hypothetical protein [Pseudomonadota bacterium]
SFNPCSYGFARKTPLGVIVQSPAVEFQSLFLWIRPEDRGVDGDLSGGYLSFNPCSYGFARKTIEGLR